MRINSWRIEAGPHCFKCIFQPMIHGQLLGMAIIIQSCIIFPPAMRQAGL